MADWIGFKSYKLSEPIFLSDGELDSPAETAQKSSFLFRAFGGNEQPALARLYFLPEIEAEVDSVIAKNC